MYYYTLIFSPCFLAENQQDDMLCPYWLWVKKNGGLGGRRGWGWEVIIQPLLRRELPR